MIIGICGGTGSGKTTIARAIVDAVGRANVVLVEQDSYYRNLSDMPLDERHQVLVGESLQRLRCEGRIHLRARIRVVLRARPGFGSCRPPGRG